MPILSAKGETSSVPAKARWLIEHFKMERIPQEGAWFAPTYRSAEAATITEPARAGEAESCNAGSRYAGLRAAYSAIYCVQTRADFSGLHRLATDELWHFYDGDPLELLLLWPDGRGETVTMGRDIAAGQRPQFLVPRDVWQAARPMGGDDAWTLIGNSLAPGFEYADFEIGYREELQARYPAWAGKIAELTRAEHGRRA